MPYAQDTSMSPFSAAGAGIGAGIAGTILVSDVKKAKSRANWALGIGIGLMGLMLANSGNLNTATTQATQVATSANGLAFNGADLPATQLQIAGLRAQVVSLANTVAQIGYYSNDFNFFQSQPTLQPTPVQTTAVASGTVLQNNSNQNLAILLLVGVGVAAVVLS